MHARKAAQTPPDSSPGEPLEPFGAGSPEAPALCYLCRSVSTAAARLAELVALLAEPPTGTRPTKPPAKSVDDAIEKLAEAVVAGAPLPAAPGALERIVPALRGLHRGALPPASAAALLAEVALALREEAMPLRKALRALTCEGDASTAHAALGGLLALGVDLAQDDALLARLDLLLAARPLPPPLAARGLAQDRSAQSWLIERSSRATAAERARAARLLGWLASTNKLPTAEHVQLARALADDDVLPVWIAANAALGRWARSDPRLAAELVQRQQTASLPARRRNALALTVLHNGSDGGDGAAALAALVGERDVWLQGALAFGLAELADEGARYEALRARLFDRRRPTIASSAGRALERLFVASHEVLPSLHASLAASCVHWELVEARDGASRARLEETLQLCDPARGEDAADPAWAVGRRLAFILRCEAEQSRAPSVNEVDALLSALRLQLATLDRLDPDLPLREQAQALYRLDDALELLFERDTLFALARRSSGPGWRSSEAELEHLRSSTARRLLTLVEGGIDDARATIVLRGLGRCLDTRWSSLGSLQARLGASAETSAAGASLSALLTRGDFGDPTRWRALAAPVARALADWPAAPAAGDALTRYLLALLAQLEAEQLQRLLLEYPKLPRAGALDAFAAAISASTEGDVGSWMEALQALGAALPAGPTSAALAIIVAETPQLRSARPGEPPLPEPPLPERMAALLRFLPALAQLLRTLRHPHQPKPAPEDELDQLDELDELDRLDQLLRRLREAVGSLSEALVGVERVEEIATLAEGAARLLAGRGRWPWQQLLRQVTAPFVAQAREAGARTLVRIPHEQPARAASPPPIGASTRPALRPVARGAAEPELRRAETAERPAPVALPAAAAALAEDYELLRPLGAGGLGLVFEARQRALDRPVAIKFLHPRLARDPAHRARFAREARSMARWTHPHIVRVIDFREHEELALVLELIAGRTLAELPRRALDQELATARQIALALAYAHADGVIHRDVCPDNVLLRDDTTALLTDFGIAADTLQPRLTEDHAVLGRPLYMSPEQLEGAEPSAAMDVYGLGVLLYERLTGALPFQAESLDALVALKLADRYLPASMREANVPLDVDALLATMLRSVADQRPSAEQAARRIAELQAEHTTPSPCEAR